MNCESEDDKQKIVSTQNACSIGGVSTTVTSTGVIPTSGSSSTSSNSSTTSTVPSNTLHERRRNWRIHRMKSCMPSSNYTLTPVGDKGDSGARMLSSRQTDELHNKENWWRKTICHEPSTLVTPFAQILAILNRARDFLSDFTSSTSSHSNDSNMFGMQSPRKTSESDEKYSNHLHQFDVHYVNELLHEFDWCLEVLESLQCKRSVSSLTRMKFRTLLSQELAASFNPPDTEMKKNS
ncbi:unnamed protein product [Heterobilharzia americana]|nr:unnamed protein product [Heterobilharzia americana]